MANAGCRVEDTGLIINDYRVYADTDTEPGHYTFYMEPEHIVPKEDIPPYRDAIEYRMMQANQLKPVRVLDTPPKLRFFHRLIENYGETTE